MVSVMPTERPRVVLNFSSSLDGKISTVPSHRPAAFALSRGQEDRRRMLALRGRCDAILIGANSLRVDNPDLGLDPAETERRRAENLPMPYRMVVTHLGQAITHHCNVFNPGRGGPAIVFHPATMPLIDREILRGHARLVELGESAVDLRALLGWVHRELGVSTLLCEGGGIVAAELFALGAVDELYLTVVPRILGGRDAPTPVSGPGCGPEDVPDGSLRSVERVGDELFLEYTFDWRSR